MPKILWMIGVPLVGGVAWLISHPWAVAVQGRWVLLPGWIKVALILVMLLLGAGGYVVVLLAQKPKPIPVEDEGSRKRREEQQAAMLENQRLAGVREQENQDKAKRAEIDQALATYLERIECLEDQLRQSQQEKQRLHKQVQGLVRKNERLKKKPGGEHE